MLGAVSGQGMISQNQMNGVARKREESSGDKVEMGGSNSCGFTEQMSQLREKAATMGNYLTTTKIQECGQGVHGPRFDVSLEFPHLKNDNGFNDLMQQKMETKAGWFIKGLHFDYNEAPDGEVAKGGHSHLTLRHQFCNTLPNGVVSARMGGDSYVAGCPYPNNLVETVNYDTKTGQEIHLPDLFNKNTNYLEALTKEVIRKADKENGSELADALFSCLKPLNAGNFENFNIGNGGLSIVLTASENSSIPHALGTTEVFIPYKDLQGFINPNGPAGGLHPETCGL